MVSMHALYWLSYNAVMTHRAEIYRIIASHVEQVWEAFYLMRRVDRIRFRHMEDLMLRYYRYALRNGALNR